MFVKLLTLFSCLLFSFVVKSQEVIHIDSRKKTPPKNTAAGAGIRIFTKTEVEAAFPGGDKAWTKYLETNLDTLVTVIHNAPAGRYEVLVRFIVSEDGSISDVKTQTNYGYGMEEEAKRLIRKGPRWIPAVQNGRKVNAYRTQPVIFIVGSQK